MSLDARKPAFGGFHCEQHRRRPACAFAQSDQRLCYSRFRKYHIWDCYKRDFIFLAILCCWAGWFESHFVGHPEDRFCRDEAPIILMQIWCTRNKFTLCNIMFRFHFFLNRFVTSDRKKIPIASGLSWDMWFPTIWHFDKCRLRRACAAPF